MEYAEKEFKVPMIIDPVDMIENPEELSIMTAIHFYLKYDENPDPGDVEVYFTSEYKFVVAGKGLKEMKVGLEGTFHVAVSDKKDDKKPIENVLDQFTPFISGPDSQCKLTGIDGSKPGTYKFLYKPTAAGEYKISLNFKKEAVFSEKQVNWIPTAFAVFDLDNSGTLDREELEIFLIALEQRQKLDIFSAFFGPEINSVPLILNKIFKEFDTNNDSEIQLDEFVQWVQKIPALSDVMEGLLPTKKDYHEFVGNSNSYPINQLKYYRKSPRGKQKRSGGMFSEFP